MRLVLPMRFVMILVTTLITVAGVLAIQFVAAHAQATPTSDATVTYYACVNNKTGAPTIVNATTTCSPSSHKIQWDQQGPTGPAGPQGPLGATGPQGPQGPAGATLTYTGFNYYVGLTANVAMPVVATNAVQAGQYVINASISARIGALDTVQCEVGTSNTGPGGKDEADIGGPSEVSSFNASLVDTLSVAAGDQIEVFCNNEILGSSSYIAVAALSALPVTSTQMHIVGKHSFIPSKRH